MPMPMVLLQVQLLKTVRLIMFHRIRIIDMHQQQVQQEQQQQVQQHDWVLIHIIQFEH